MSILVGLLMGSASDWRFMQATAEILKTLEIPFETKVISAHRTPELAASYAETAEERGLEVIIAAAGGAAHLAGAMAARTTIPVLGVPLDSSPLNGMDALLSTVQMPGGVPVGTLGIGRSGAVNAALLATAILANSYPEIKRRLKAYREEQKNKVLNSTIDYENR